MYQLGGGRGVVKYQYKTIHMAGEGGGQKYPKKDPHGLKLKMTPNLEANLLIQFLYSY